MKSKSKALEMQPFMSPLTVLAFAVGTSVGWESLVVTSNTYLKQAGPWGSVFGLLIGALAPIGLAWLKGAFGLSIGMASLAAAAVLGLALVAGLCISPNPNGKDKA